MNHSTRFTRLATAFILGAAAICSPLGQAANEPKVLWQIGLPDGRNAELALAPGGYGQFKADAFYVVGESQPGQDWPYVQPGPSDAWAGQRPHTFTILFGLKTQPSAGESRLRVRLVDTHPSGPPTLRVQVNGQEFARTVPHGRNDASVRGQELTGEPFVVDIRFSSDLLRVGDNDVQITTVAGSWMLYDSVELETPGGAELATAAIRSVVASVQPIRALRDKAGQSQQPVRVTLRHFGAPEQATLEAEGAAPQSILLHGGEQTAELLFPAVTEPVARTISITAGGKPLAQRTVTLRPVRKLTIYVLPHSHTDIGYTEIQTAIENKQINNLMEGIAAARRTASYPEGARFVWNVEVLWAADLYLNRLSPAQRAEFFEAVQKGWIGLNGMYLNELTGLCRPEELVQLFRYSTQLASQCNVAIDSAMISDVPGYTWGTVTAMAHAGIRYFSTAPNYFDRIGDILVKWENKPFWWASPSGRERVLVWIPYMGYAMSHLIHQFTPEFVDEYQSVLEKEKYPYDIAHVRWSGHGDNAIPDPAICEFFKEWTTNYAWPKFIVARTSDAFRAFEKQYGESLPVVRGDWTPYWEDGAGSSAFETALNRNTSDRLVQAQALFALRNPEQYPVAAFDRAWRDTLLYSEHTWGADCSVSDPESTKTKEQWAIKQSYALDADKRSQALLRQSLPSPSAKPETKAAPSATASVDVFNTTSWARTELVLLPKELSQSGDRVRDDAGDLLPSQRLQSGELAFVARDVPPFAARRYVISAGTPFEGEAVMTGPEVLANGLVSLRIDSTSGGLVELKARGVDENLVDTSSGEKLNEFVFLPGEDVTKRQGNGPVTITVKERGPLVASLLVESDAPACRKLTREIRMVSGLGYVELIDTVDKTRAEIPTKAGDGAFAQKKGKESINFAFPFNVPRGEVSLDLPLGWMRPEIEQMPSACKNWFTVGRWADVGNPEFGVTLVTLDAPLFELGGLTANMTGSQTNPKTWRQQVEPSQRLYVWAMNNHWHTNYRAYQDGPVTFRFVLWPHGRRDPAAASRFATGFSQPLLPAAAAGPTPPARGPRLTVQPPSVLVTALKPSDDGKAWIVRLFGAGGKDAAATLSWSDPAPRQMVLSDTSEKPGAALSGPITVPAWGLVSVRAER